MRDLMVPYSRVSFLLPLILVIASLSGASHAEAATRTWTGATDQKWTTPGNWDGGVAPVPGDDLVFPAGGLVLNTANTNDFAGGTNFRSITFGGGNYAVSGNRILLDIGIDFQVGSAVSLSIPITLNGDHTWITNSISLTVAGGIDLNGHTLTINAGSISTIAAIISGTGAIIKNGAGQITLSGANTYSGPTTITAGKLTVSTVTGLGVADGTLANGTILTPSGNLQFPTTLIVQGVAIGNEAISNSGGLVTATSAAASIAGPITIDANATFSGGGFVTTPLTLSGIVSGPGSLGFSNDGTLILTNGGNTFAGGVSQIPPGTTLVLGADHALPAPADITMSGSATLTLNGTVQTIGDLSGSNTLNVSNGAVLTLNQTHDTTFGDFVNGNGVIDYVGTGHLTLGGPVALNPGDPVGTFSGPFTIDHGTVTLSGARIPSAPFTVNTGATIGYANFGTSGPVTVHGGHLQLFDNDNPDGTSGSLVLDSASTFDVGVSVAKTSGVPRPATPGKLTVTGTVTLGNATLSFAPTSFNPPAGSAFTIIDNDGTDPVSGTFKNLPEGATFIAAGNNYRITYMGGDGNDVVLMQTDYLLTEGATGSFFTTDILIANPNNVTAPVHITYFLEGGGQQTQDLSLPALSQHLIRVNLVPGMESQTFSSVVHSVNAVPLVVERTMSWDTSGYGAHTEHATDGPATTWYFAEGSQGFFHTYLLLANPQTFPITASVQYLREGEAVLTRTYPVPATSRFTVDLSTEPEVQNRSFGMVVTFSSNTSLVPGPGSAERAMYFGDVPLFSGGHESAGVNAPSKTWFLAEGATGPFFETFILLANPGDTDATVTLTYLPAGGTPIVKTKMVPAHARVTVNIEPDDPALSNAAVSTQIVSTQPILAERSQYWPDPAPNWYEAHNSFGLTTLATKWGLAEGRVGNVDGYANAQTYILLANPGTTAANVSIMFLRDDGKTPVTKTFTVPPTTRMNVAIGSGGGDAPELTNEHFGAVVTSDRPIAVERAVYWDAIGQVWAAGTNATATRLP